MVKIGIFEVKTHEQYLLHLCRILPDDDLTLFTTRPILEEVAADTDISEATSEIKRDDEPVSKYLQRVERASRDLDVMLWFPFSGGTRELLTYARVSLDCPSLLWIFNVRGWLEAPVLTTKPTAGLRRGIKRWLVRKQSGLLFEYPCIETYVRENGLTKKPTQSIVPTLYDGIESHSPSDPIVVTVPGNVDPDRRNYDEVIDAFRDATESGTDIELEVLGPPANEGGERVLRRCESLIDRGYDITVHREWVPVAQFQQAIQSSTLLVAPLTRTKIVEETVESYGTTKGSASVSDAIRNATPLVLPQHAGFTQSLGEASLTYAGRSDLARLLERVATDEPFRNRLTESARNNAVRYTRERQHARVDRLLDTILA
ncbi:hypothetical protein [Halorientalis marina]|uniref:hypothetical protein n=1 Tax=Halorientalis marina TaxID=2931976 RepID=UPI001FF66B38|nr:hypothetical protein [Halorientalis marina]